MAFERKLLPTFIEQFDVTHKMTSCVSMFKNMHERFYDTAALVKY